DVCSSDLHRGAVAAQGPGHLQPCALRPQLPAAAALADHQRRSVAGAAGLQPSRVPPVRPRCHRAAGDMARATLRCRRGAQRPAGGGGVMAAAEHVATEHLDVLVVGAGLSGICAGHYVQAEYPWASYAIFEARGAIGGTWDLFRSPGVRSDSDMFTLGYPFRPWKSSRMIVDGDSIRHYIEDTAAEEGI